jgi:enoyl-CoA hydratase/carnithine racemase
MAGGRPKPFLEGAVPMSVPDTVRISLEPPVAHVLIDRPPENVLGLQELSDLAATVSRVDKEASVHAAILAGAGGTFCGGIDLTAFEALDPKRLLVAAQLGQDVAWRIEHSEKIWVAAVEGAARGGGLDLALACDLLTASEGARFESPEVESGWMPFFGGTQRLRLAAGRAKAREVILAGTAISAREALAAGFVNHVVPDGRAMAMADAVAVRIASRPWPAVRAAKKVLVEQMDKPYRNGFLLEAQYFAQLIADRKTEK